MKIIIDGIKVPSVSIEKVVIKHRKCFLKMCGNPAAI